MRFPAKITSSCIWVAVPVDWVILDWYACGADGRSRGRAIGRSVYGHVITNFSRMARILHFRSHGAPLTPFALESAAIIIIISIVIINIAIIVIIITIIMTILMINIIIIIINIISISIIIITIIIIIIIILLHEKFL